MSSNNIFSGKRFLLLCKQHIIHNNRFLLYASIAYIGVIFLFLSAIQMAQDREPHDFESFMGFLLSFVAIFGILYIGHSFPAFRSKEQSINYLMVPGSTLEKFLFECLSRIGLALIGLPLLFYITFHLQGYFFNLFSSAPFEPVGIEIIQFSLPDEVKEMAFWLVTFIGSLIMLGCTLPFTGSAMFSKQPLVKTLFSVAIIVIFYAFIIYLALETFGVGQYNPNDSLWLVPNNENSAFRLFACVAILTNMVMLFVAYRKLKEKEV